MFRKLKKLLRKRKSEMDSREEEELNKSLQRHEKDHFLCPFAGINSDYMEMSMSSQLALGKVFKLIFSMSLLASSKGDAWEKLAW